MKNRIIQILEKYQLTPSRFADEIGVQRSSISHILAERNKPSLEIAQKILNCYPALNAEWLLLGSGSMVKNENENANLTPFANDNIELHKKEQLELFEEHKAKTTTEKNSNDSTFEKNSNNKVANSLSNEENIKDKFAQNLVNHTLAVPEIEKIILIYKDKTFEVYHPKC